MNMNDMKYRIIRDEVKPGIRAVQAGAEDKAAVNGLMVQAAAWLQSKGSKQWHELLAGEDRHGVPEAIGRGDVFIFKKGEALVNMVILQQHASAWDRSLWGRRGMNPPFTCTGFASTGTLPHEQLGSAILTGR